MCRLDPIYRVEKAMRRAGVPISRSTMNDLVLLAAETLIPLWSAARDEMRRDALVLKSGRLVQREWKVSTAAHRWG